MKKSYEFETKIHNYAQVFLVNYEILCSGTPVMVTVNYDSLPLVIDLLDDSLVKLLVSAMENNWDTVLRDHLLSLFGQVSKNPNLFGMGAQMLMEHQEELHTADLIKSARDMRKQIRENPVSMRECVGEEVVDEFLLLSI